MGSWPEEDKRAGDRPSRIEPGTLLGSFKIVERLGAGGMGEVFRAEHVYVPDRPAAIKVLKTERAQRGDFEKRFRSEASKLANLSKLKHPNIVEFYDANIQDGLAWIAMELLAGSSLDGILLRQGRVSVPDALLILSDALDGLHAAHLCGLIHRDLKPANIFLTSTGVVKLLDFGTSKLVKARPTLRKLQPSTEKNIVHGTWTYMSPEQILGEPPLDHTSDLFTMAIIAYELVTGRHPFAGDDELEDRQALGYRACINPPNPIHRFLPDCPEDLWTLLGSMLAKHPEDRPASAAKVAERMRDIRGRYLAERGLPIARLEGLTAAGAPALAPTEPAARVKGEPEAQSVEAPTSATVRIVRPLDPQPAASPAPGGVDLRKLDRTVKLPHTAPATVVAATPSPVVVAPVRFTASEPTPKRARSTPTTPAPANKATAVSPRRRFGPPAFAAFAICFGIGIVVWAALQPRRPSATALPDSVAPQSAPVAAATSPTIVARPPATALASGKAPTTGASSAVIGTRDPAANSKTSPAIPGATGVPAGAQHRTPASKPSATAAPSSKPFRPFGEFRPDLK